MITEWTLKTQTYTPGLSIEEIKKKYSLKEVYKMASNENPLPLPKELLQVLQKSLSHIQRYPSYMHPVVDAVSRHYQVDHKQVILGNGSSELIDKLTQAYGEPDSAVLMSEKSFPLYSACAQAHRLKIYKAKTTTDLKVNVPEILDLVRTHNNIRLIFISNPNNPTGSYINHSELKQLLSETQDKNVLLVLDEAYWGYIQAKDFPSALSLLPKYPHMVLLRSMSKIMGLAGLRAGVMIAHPSVTETVKNVTHPFNVNIMAVQAILFCLSDHPSVKKYLSDSKKLVWNSLNYFYDELGKAGLRFYPSQGNFVLFSAGKPGVFQALLKRGLILRALKDPGLENHLRMSVSIQPENEKAMKLIKEVC